MRELSSRVVVDAGEIHASATYPSLSFPAAKVKIGALQYPPIKRSSWSTTATLLHNILQRFHPRTRNAHAYYT